MLSVLFNGCGTVCTEKVPSHCFNAVTLTITDIRDTSILHDADGEEFPADPRDHRYIYKLSFSPSSVFLVHSGRR